MVIRQFVEAVPCRTALDDGSFNRSRAALRVANDLQPFSASRSLAVPQNSRFHRA
jgi:hypothetical protein